MARFVWFSRLMPVLLGLFIAGCFLCSWQTRVKGTEQASSKLSRALMKSYQLYKSTYKAGKYATAAGHAERALKLGKREFGPHDKRVAIFLNNLAAVYVAQGRYGKAEPLFARSLTITQKVLGATHLNTATALNNFAEFYRATSQYTKAEPLYKRSLEIFEKKLGRDHQNVGTLLNNLAQLYRLSGQYAKAEPYYKRSLKITEKAMGRDHVSVAISLGNLAGLYEEQGRYIKAEQLYKRDIAIKEKALGLEHPSLATTLSNLALIYEKQGRAAEAEQLHKRALAIREKRLHPKHPSIATSLNNLAGLYENSGREVRADELYQRALAIREKALGANHPRVATVLNNMAEFYRKTGRNKKAERFYLRGLNIRLKKLGRNHPLVATNLNNLAVFYEKSGQLTKAGLLYRQALSIREKTLGPDHPLVATSLNNLAGLWFGMKDWAKAADYWQRATSILMRRANRQKGAIGKPLSGKGKTLVDKNSWFFTGLVKATFRQDADATRSSETSSKMFEMAQWAIGSKAAGALAQMSARQAKGDGVLATLVRERQDSLREWQNLDRRLVSTRSRPAAKRNRQAETILFLKMQQLDKRIAQIDKKLAADFPDYAALINPAPLSIRQVQKQLRPNEALVLAFDTPRAGPAVAETFVWAITKDKAVWRRTELGGKELADKVASLRKALDPTTGTRSANSRRGLVASSEGTFNLSLAHELYKKLLGPVEELIKDKAHLMVISSGPLTALPLHVLVSQKPDESLQGNDRYRQAIWLLKRHAITTLPSVSSLKSLRAGRENAHRAPLPLIGFADPVFSQIAPKEAVQGTDATPLKKRDMKKRGFASYFRGGLADLAVLSQLAQLPETRTELKSIAKTLKVTGEHIRLGRHANEKAVKTLRLDRYRTVYFATHGLVAGDIKGLAEPALAFSLPARASPLDDGLLTASEISQLKLNADWLVMSACNTAAGDKPGAQALSGLARAFFYAGARTLLVSHWPVYSDAATALTTKAFAHMSQLDKNNTPIGRSQALRHAMLFLLQDKSRDDNAHPSVWAPFVVVGEGAGQ